MITFKINGTKYNFPTTWGDVTYEQYIGLLHTTSITDQIHVFTDIPRETLDRAEITNLEKINLALSFLSFTPKFERTELIGRYLVPADVTLKSTRQFEDLRGLLKKMPKDVDSIENAELLAELYLNAAAIYCQKERDGVYDSAKVSEVAKELRSYPASEVLGNGGFFISRPVTSSPTLTTRFQRVIQHLKKKVQGLPGYQKTLDFMLRSTGSRAK